MTGGWSWRVGAPLALALAAVATGCKRDERAAPARPAVAVVRDAGAAAPIAAKPPAADPLSWVHDDYAAALARAKAAGLPLFIDLWAAWCHTCIAMQEHVLRDPALRPYADRFVWLAIDTERPDSADVLRRFPPEVWPTFFVVSSSDESIQARHVGAGSVAQMRALLEAGERGHLATRAAGGGLERGDPLWQVREGDRAATAGDHAAADRAFGRALAAAPPDWSRAPAVLVRQLAARSRRDDHAGCVALGAQALDRTRAGATASASDFASLVAGCIDHAPLAPPEAVALRRRLVAHLLALLEAPDASLSVDDRSDALSIARGLLEKLGDKARALELAERQRVLLDRAVADARSPLEASTYSMHRVEAYLAVGRGAELVAALEQSERELPSSYDAPYRLAQLLRALGRHVDALAAARRALERADGPRRARILELIAQAQHDLGDHAGERRTRDEQVAFYAALPASHKRATAEAAAKRALAAHDAGHAVPPTSP